MANMLKLCQHMNLRLGWYTGSAMLLGVALGNVAQPAFLKSLIPIALFFMLYPMMIDTRLSSIGNVFRNPRILLLALFFNFGFCPLLITVISKMFRLGGSPNLEIGLLLFAVVPCGGMVPALTGMLKGNTTLSITITALSLLLSVLMVPLWTELLAGRWIPVPAMLIARYMTFIILLPLTLAMLTRTAVTRRWGEKKYQHVRIHLQNLSGFGLVLLCFTMFVFNGQIILEDPLLVAQVVVPITIFLSILLFSAITCCKHVKLAKADGIALTVSSSVKNFALSLALAFMVFDAEVAMIITIAGSMVQLPMMIGFLKLRL